MIVTLDIRKYFPSTSSQKVFWFFNSVMECPRDVASILAQLTTCQGHLATGSPASPILAYFANIAMWEAINKRVISQGCILTVYMDDVTISGPVVPGDLEWSVKQEIFGHGLRYHKEKRYSRGFAEVTGIGLSNGEAILPRRKHKKLYDTRLALRAAPDGDEKERLSASLKGQEAQQRYLGS